MADINILVAVDTKDIAQDNLDTTIVLVDDNQDTDTNFGNSSTFSTIKPGGGVSIQWLPVAMNGIDRVQITAINKVSGDDCFNMPPTLEAGGKAMIAHLVDNNGDNELQIKYDIVLTVSNKKGSSFTLDPEIRIPPSRTGGR